jgi:riboflavin synthase
MFTGIIEQLGHVKEITSEGGNIHITVQASLTSELKIDQSVAHNGVCLTVVSIDGNNYTVTAIQETLEKTNLCDLEVGTVLN